MFEKNGATGTRNHSSLWIAGLCTALLFALGCDRELGVYTLCKYENNWKSQICPSQDKDPYYLFWDTMAGGDKDTAINPNGSNGSARQRNSDVHIASVLPISTNYRSWDEFDMVFFFGHHNAIETPHGGPGFHYWTYIESVTAWQSHSGNLDTMGWGHDTPYDYWAERPVVDANIHPAAVTYLYYRWTSTLTGGTRDYGGGTVPWRQNWYSPKNFLAHDKLGSNDLEWLILDGCQAVITATKAGSYLPLALNTFAPTQGGWHIILGHYKSYYVSQMASKDGFAMDLRAGVPVQQAYFDTDPNTNSSAIAAEKPSFSWASSTMVNDTWTDQVADINGATLFSQRWIVSLGFADETWGTP